MQRYRDAIDFGLDPHIRAGHEPVLDRLGIGELGQAGLGDWMGNGPVAADQRVCRFF